MSVHKPGCRIAPTHTHRCADGSVWEVSRLSRGEVFRELAVRQTRSTQISRICVQCGGLAEPIPRDEVVRRYRDKGELVETIVRDLRSRGITTSQATLYTILREEGVPRVRSKGARPTKVPDLKQLAKRYARGRGESLCSLAKEAGVSACVLAARLEEAGHKKSPPSRRRPE
ncbi:hypothetical protein [Streptomyces cucumeris]|uniref:hypothetical protein n=1 Tax=Streptomyces cucumeris TaxID=2962890 RepID=UPI0020C90186|nr:hypothetical protein [Streptomyces sp. NEAU-Y11]MCP9209533.1 hypothetical protein [Streptomyces sp. NEAU-Y11]